MIHFMFKIQDGCSSCMTLLHTWTMIKLCVAALDYKLCSWYSKHRKRYSFLLFTWGKFKLCKIYYKISGPKNYTVKLLSKIHLMCVWEEHFQLTLDDETLSISFERRQFPNLPSELIFAENVLAKIQVFSLSYGIVNINNHITYITNEVLTSRHDCFWTLHLWTWLDKKAGWLQTVHAILFNVP